MMDRLITLPQLSRKRASCSTDAFEMLSVGPDDLSCVVEGFDCQLALPMIVPQSSTLST